MSVVVDASAAAAWAFADERTSNSLAMLRHVGKHGAAVPAIWPLEVANMLLFGERRGRITRSERDALVARLDALPVRVDGHAPGQTGHVLTLADTHDLTAYDAAYLELAMRLGYPLVSKDGALVAAAAKVGVEVLAA